MDHSLAQDLYFIVQEPRSKLLSNQSLPYVDDRSERWDLALTQLSICKGREFLKQYLQESQFKDKRRAVCQVLLYLHQTQNSLSIYQNLFPGSY